MPSILPGINNEPAQGIQATLDLIYLWNPSEAQTLINTLNTMQELLGRIYVYSDLVGKSVWKGYPCSYNGALYIAATNIASVPATFDATQWTVISTATVAFAGITGQPTDNVNLATALNGKQTANLVTSISSSSTDAQYPSAKCMYDVIGNIEATLNAIRGI